MAESSKLKVNYVVSLGTTCHVSNFCKTHGLKRFSCPFDWIFSNAYMILNCLNTQFSVFLDRNQYMNYDDSLEGIGLRRAGHKTYGKRMFNHHDPRNEEDYQYFVRCVDRFYKVLGEDVGEKLFIHMMHTASGELPAPYYNALNKVEVMLSKTCKRFVLLLVICTVCVDDEVPGYSVANQDSNIIVVRMNTRSKSNGKVFVHDEDNKMLEEIVEGLFDFSLHDIDTIQV